jgi:hypothetical protein
MAISGKTLRDLERAAHLLAGTLFVLLVYTPLGSGDIGFVLRTILLVPITGSGLAMWQHGRIAKATRGGRRMPAPVR